MIKINSPADRAAERFGTALFIILSGGFQDAYTYCVRDNVFANAQTGNIVLLSTVLYGREWQTVLKYLGPVLSFLAGTEALCAYLRVRHKEILKKAICLCCALLSISFCMMFVPEGDM